MWCRFLTFCVLVSFILFVVATCIYGRPSFHLFFHRCCGDDIENDQVIFENFGNNFLKERLVGGDIIEADSEIVLENEDIGRITDEAKVLSINDPDVKKWIADTHIRDRDNPDTDLEDEGEDIHIDEDIRSEEEEHKFNLNNNETSQKDVEIVTEIASTLSVAIAEDQIKNEMYIATTAQRNTDKNKEKRRSYEALNKGSEVETETATIKYLNVHDYQHKKIAKAL